MRGHDGQEIQITKIERDFISYLDIETGAHGRIMRRFFTQLFTPEPHHG